MRVAIAARNLRGKTGVSAIVLEHVRQIIARGGRADVFGEKLDKELVIAAGGKPIKLSRLPLSRYLARRYFSYRVHKATKTQHYEFVIGNSELLHQDVTFVHNLTALESELVPSPISQGMAAKMRFDHKLFTDGSFKICIANSNLTKNELIKRHNVKPELIHVVYPGYDPKLFSRVKRSVSRRKLRLQLCEPNDFLIGFITSGHFAKRGADIMLESLSKLGKGLLEKTKVLAIGSDDNLSSLKQQFNNCGLGSVLIQRGKANDLEPYYHSIDLLFHPARMEEFGLVVAEAAACGTPVLSSKMTGSTEIFTNAGIDLPDIPNHELFADYLNRFIRDDQLRERIAEKQNKAISNHTWSDYFQRLYNLYDQHGLIS